MAVVGQPLSRQLCANSRTTCYTTKTCTSNSLLWRCSANRRYILDPADLQKRKNLNKDDEFLPRNYTAFKMKQRLRCRGAGKNDLLHCFALLFLLLLKQLDLQGSEEQIQSQRFVLNGMPDTGIYVLSSMFGRYR